MKTHWSQRFTVIILTVLAALLLGVIVFLARESFLVISIMLSKNAYLPRALDKFFLVTIGLVWLLGWFLFEGYLNLGIAKKNILARFLRLLGWEMVALFALSVWAYFFTSAGVSWLAVGLLAAAFVIGVVLLFVSRGLFTAQQKL